jgi:hypothetical protein
MRSQLTALVRVQTLLEQRPEDYRFNGRPIQRRRRVQRIKVGLLQGQAGYIVEQPAVKPRNPRQPEPPAMLYGVELGVFIY